MAETAARLEFNWKFSCSCHKRNFSAFKDKHSSCSTKKSIKMMMNILWTALNGYQNGILALTRGKKTREELSHSQFIFLLILSQILLINYGYYNPHVSFIPFHWNNVWIRRIFSWRKKINGKGIIDDIIGIETSTISISWRGLFHDGRSVATEWLCQAGKGKKSIYIFLLYRQNNFIFTTFNFTFN